MGDTILVEVLSDPLDAHRYTAFAEDSGAGALVTFDGVTRDTFQGRRVVRLEYEAYVPMLPGTQAESELRKLCEEMLGKFDVKRVAVAHRLGVVPVGESSVIIVVSSSHRKPAFQAAEFMIDELKARVPIWKREVYEDGSVWKGNAESRLQQHSQTK